MAVTVAVATASPLTAFADDPNEFVHYDRFREAEVGLVVCLNEVGGSDRHCLAAHPGDGGDLFEIAHMHQVYGGLSTVRTYSVTADVVVTDATFEFRADLPEGEVSLEIDRSEFPPMQTNWRAGADHAWYLGSQESPAIGSVRIATGSIGAVEVEAKPTSDVIDVGVYWTASTSGVVVFNGGFNPTVFDDANDVLGSVSCVAPMWDC